MVRWSCSALAIGRDDVTLPAWKSGSPPPPKALAAVEAGPPAEPINLVPPSQRLAWFKPWLDVRQAVKTKHYQWGLTDSLSASMLFSLVRHHSDSTVISVLCAGSLYFAVLRCSP